MAKRKRQTVGLENFSTRIQEAKTFHDVVAILVAEYEGQIQSAQSQLKSRRRISTVDREWCERQVRTSTSQLRKLDALRSTYEEYQANKKLPARLRKQIASLQTDLLRCENMRNDYLRGYVRERKKDLAQLLEEVDRILNPPKPLATKNRAFRVGGTFSGQSITRAYDGHVWEVLKGHFEALPRTKKGQRASVRIVAALPDKSEYAQVKEHHFTTSLEELLDDAYGIVDELQAELQEAYDNMPEGLQESAAGESRQEAAEQLGSISGDQPDVPPCLSSIHLVHYPSLHQSSRRDRAAEAAAMMRVSAKAVQEHLDGGAKLKKAEARAVDEFVQQLEDHAGEIDDVEFPGMFG